jgi:hypothetical protein
MESNHPGVGLPRPAGFEDRMGHQTPAAPFFSLLAGCARFSSIRRVAPIPGFGLAIPGYGP